MQQTATTRVSVAFLRYGQGFIHYEVYWLIIPPLQSSTPPLSFTALRQTLANTTDQCVLLSCSMVSPSVSGEPRTSTLTPPCWRPLAADIANL